MYTRTIKKGRFIQNLKTNCNNCGKKLEFRISSNGLTYSRIITCPNNCFIKRSKDKLLKKAKEKLSQKLIPLERKFPKVLDFLNN